jgi:asparagine synthase (glutamine-hydrolysing)
MEFCVALPASLKLSQGWPRYILRRATEGILPEKIRWRFTKADLSPNFRARLLECERDRLHRLVIDDPSRIEQFFDINSLRAAYWRYVRDPYRSESEPMASTRP